MKRPILLIVDAKSPEPVMMRALERLLTHSGKYDLDLHIMAFVEDPSEVVLRRVRSVWPGRLKVVDTATYLGMTADTARQEIDRFVEKLRSRLWRVAAQAVGREWAHRFDEHWWYTAVSEKNSPGNPAWWILFRLEAVKRRLSEITYERCLFVGDSVLMELLGQLCEARGLDFKGQLLDRARLGWLRLVVKRLIGLLCLTYAVAVARRRFANSGQQVLSQKTFGRSLLAYTFFPRVWTTRSNVWQDRYYGQTLDKLKNMSAIYSIYILRIYDKNYISPWVYKRRLKTLAGSERPQPYVVLEAFGTPWLVVKTYARIRDLLCFWRTVHSASYGEAFHWQDLNLASLFSPLIWHSIAVAWPHLDMLEKHVQRVVEVAQPAATLLYCFEYMYGRAIIRGTRRAGLDSPILGMLQGPIAPTKLLYSGVPREFLEETTTGGAGLPQPDVYATDGLGAKEILCLLGVTAEAITVTGAARFDTIWPRALAAAKRPRFQNNPVKVLVAPGLHDTEFVVHFVLTALARDRRLQLIIKHHPKVSSSLIQTMVDSFFREEGEEQARVQVVHQREIYQWMETSDVFLSTYSSTGVEALAFGLPVILLVSRRIPDMSVFSFHKNPAVLRASTAEALRAHINLLLENERWRAEYVEGLSQVVQSTFDQLDGRASERLANLCVELSSKRTGSHQLLREVFKKE